MMKGPNFPPGFSPEDTPKKQASKSAKKNAARKVKRLEKDSAEDSVRSSTGKAADRPPLAPPDGSAAPAASQQDDVDPVAAAEKKIRNIRKKLRQCEATQAKAEEGKQLTAEEEAKLGNRAQWEGELQDLESQLSALKLERGS